MKKVIVITGVGKGFGEKLLRHFSSEYVVIGLTRSEADFEKIRNDSSINRRNIFLHQVDVSNYEKVEEILNVYIQNSKYQIYGLINNAGVRCRMNFLEMSIQDIKGVCEVNLFAPINLTKMLIPYMKMGGEGRIINISSILSLSALPELSAYAVSKAGLDGFTRSIAAEFASQNITCNSILPGFCETSYFPNFKSKTDLYQMTLDRTPAKRWGKDFELVGLCALLLGNHGGYINGASIPVDGGWTAC